MEIEFRAWNIIVKRFQYFNLQDIENQKGQIQWHILKIDQYTNLKDKNIKKIYTGDIDSLGCVVVFHEGKFCTTYEDNNDSPSVLSKKRCSLMEIIGNIHQDKNLLK